MAICPQCGTLHMPSARTCRKCGAPLVPEERPVAPPPPRPEPPPPPTPAPQPPPRPAPRPAPPPAVVPETVTLTLVVIGSGQHIRLQSKTEYILGRSDPERGIIVDADLTDHGAWEAGVSRRHARISKQGLQVMVEDLRSANGTFLNDIRLEPGLAYPLHTGDLLKLGILRLYVDLGDGL